MNHKKDARDARLDVKVEVAIATSGQKYDRSVTHILHENGRVSVETANLGQMDFIIIFAVSKKIYITECKHMHGRYDMTIIKKDYAHFVKASKDGYNHSPSDESGLGNDEQAFD
jgi:hypothetical protein